MTREVAAAYDATGAAWQRGPERIYERLADELVARCPTLDHTSLVLDLGAGTGAATRAMRRRGAHVVALDASFGMLAQGRRDEPACVGDAYALPFNDRAFAAVIAAFSLNQVTAPVVALREAARVTSLGGTIVASAYATDDDHPAKRAVDDAARDAGWVEPGWYQELRGDVVQKLGTVEGAVGVARRAGLQDAEAEVVRVAFPELAADDLVAWRLGMAQLAPFVDGLDQRAQGRLWSDARARVTGMPALVRSIIVLTVQGVLS